MEQHCIRCGKTSPEVNFRSELALKCQSCDKVTEAEKRAYHRKYHQARHRAVQRLIEKHPKQFHQFMDEAREEIEKEDAAGG